MEFDIDRILEDARRKQHQSGGWSFFSTGSNERPDQATTASAWACSAYAEVA